jgi:hypothetical protein
MNPLVGSFVAILDDRDNQNADWNPPKGSMA